MGLSTTLIFPIFLWVSLSLIVQAQPYGYSSYLQPDEYSAIYAPPDDACPNIDVTAGLAGEDLFKAVVQAHGQSGFGVARVAKANMGLYSYGPPSPALEAIRTSARIRGIYLGAAYGLIDIGSPQQCLDIARAVVDIQSFFVSQRNNIIPGLPYQDELTGEDALQCLVKRRGQALFVARQTDSAIWYNSNPGPYLSLLINLVQRNEDIQRVVATNDDGHECVQVSLQLGQIFWNLHRLDYTDAEVLDAYGLIDAQQYSAYYH
ncbi:hypothetical protein RvY_03981-1 [Ramazzottius varieornatus]|uniref:Uncharacterized protein n=1 Tax=Ramazzottius varieornatus TaxID=947166 RepID=A0A1D1UTE9_RAMVA|nr:hypothetical protein RvY_03981-1 [Ramazzottius varieornatus]